MSAPEISRVINHFHSLVHAINLCMQQRLILPTLVLIYSGIDIAGSLYANDEETSKSSFIRWVEDFLLPDANLSCSAIDLYSARCSILHSFTAYSELYDRGKANMLVYAWGDANAELLFQAFSLGALDDVRAVSFEKLSESYKQALNRFFDRVEKEDDFASKVKARSANWFDAVSKDIVSMAVEAMKKGHDT